ncbi:hypothetical protein ACFOWZ_13845 [Lentzea rhizosphaerae]|uniref:KAP NTPase domain-containing protein n=1 Tax=Lentzea rhizosphaerae TaxID=2041025 RepID=A0ABV8BTE2_9PSEU
MTDDEVFDHAVDAALDSMRDREGADPKRLRAAAEVARPWVIAQAQELQRKHAQQVTQAEIKTVRWAGKHPVFWQWTFVVVLPVVATVAAALLSQTKTLAFLSWSSIGLGISLVALWMSRLGSVGRWVGRVWAWGGLAAPMFVAGMEFARLVGWNDWRLLVAAFAGMGVAMVLADAVATVLPTREITRAIEAVDAALREWRTAVLERGVLPVLRAELRSRERVPGIELRYRHAGGLQKGGSLISHQPVPAGRRLADLVRTLDGGSFALAGPRGAGKTSLLEAFRQGAYLEPKQPLDLVVMVAAPVDYVPREFVLHLYACACRAVLSYAELVDPYALKRAGRRDRWWRDAPDEAVTAVRAALRGLESIAYVRTQTGEASGKFGFRGAELSYKKGVSLAGRPATFPELVDDFRTFVADTAAALDPERLVIIIDEMDRIGAGEQARRFLNEIKAIFDVPGCYYLMSVSTEAQHDFELAGVGLRSVFDSSFDEVVRVDYLDHELARALISRSVEEFPEVFVALAYAFSGGVARQLIRSARAIVRQEQGTPLATVAATLIEDELDRVCKTTGDALTAAETEEDVTGLLRVLVEPEADDLRDYRKAIQAAYDGEDTAVRNLRDLAAARVEFLAIVRDYFTDDLTEVVPAQINALARARRYAGSNPATGLALLEELSAETRGRPAPAPPPP